MTKILQDFACGVVVVRKEGDRFLYLLIKEAIGYWGIPKGHKEGNETDIESARRELFEETGINDIEISGSPTFSCSYMMKKGGEDCEKTVLVFLALTNSDTTETPKNFAQEILATKWADFDEAMGLMDFRPAQKILKEANEYLEKNF